MKGIPRDLWLLSRNLGREIGDLRLGSLTTGLRIVKMIVGDTINGAACRANHPNVPYVYVNILSVLWYCWSRVNLEIQLECGEEDYSLHMHKIRP